VTASNSEHFYYARKQLLL